MGPSTALICLQRAVQAEPEETPVTWGRLTELVKDAVRDAEEYEYAERTGEDL